MMSDSRLKKRVPRVTSGVLLTSVGAALATLLLLAPGGFIYSGSGDSPDRLADSSLFATDAAQDSTRSLAEFYNRRAYPGAPPFIPHEVSDPGDYGGRACLRCHNRSRYVRRIGAYTPITPHPELLSCRSCHALPVSDEEFRENTWEKPDPPARPGGVLPDSPPPMPHSAQLRENCLVCHSGPGSVPELLTPHPERLSCRQCHVPSDASGEWVR